MKNKQNNDDINRNVTFFINLYLYLHLFQVQFNKCPYDREYLRGWLYIHFVKFNNNM